MNYLGYRQAVATALVVVVLSASVALSKTGSNVEAVGGVGVVKSYQNLTLDRSLDSNMVSLQVVNSGTGVLRITDVGTSCGLRVLRQPNRAVEPGQMTSIDLIVATPSFQAGSAEQTASEQVVLRANTPNVFEVVPVQGKYE